MKVIEGEGPERDPGTGKRKMLIEVDEDDIILIDQAMRIMIDEERVDKDDNKTRAKLKHIKENTHKTWARLHPS